MFGITPQNNGAPASAPSTNTKALTLYSEMSCLQLQYWNDNLSIKLNPATGKDANGATSYDFTNKISTAVTQERAIGILSEVHDRIMPAVEECELGNPLEKPISVAYDLGKDKSLRIQVGIKNDDTGMPVTYIAIFRGISPDGTCSNGIVYVFNKADFLRDYDNIKGNSLPQKRESEFRLFVSVLEKMTDIIGPIHHAIKHKTAMDASMSSTQFNANGGGYNKGNTNYTAPTIQGGTDDFPF